MGVIAIAHNIAALQAQRRLSESSFSLSQIFERLASGKRINRASDDAAGLAISESLNTDVRVYSQAVRNVNDGASLLNIADATVAELSGIAIRMRELASQSANGTFSDVQRKAIDTEAQALSDEFSRVVRSADFNGLGLFDGSLSDGLRVQGGFGVEGSIQSTLGKGLGSGNFGDRVSYTTESGAAGSTRAVDTGDVNGDGIADLVTAGARNNGTYYQGQVSVLLGRGSGSFAFAASYSTISASNGDCASIGLSLSDVNGDGVLDVVTVGYSPAGGQASVLLGRGDGTFGTAVTYVADNGAGGYKNALSLADLNGDGSLDLVTAGAGQASVRLGRGDGTFGAGVTYAAEVGSMASTTSDVTLGDLNGDGILDLATVGYVDNGTRYAQASVRLGRGDGTFGARTTYVTTPGPGWAHAISTGDTNGDGILDLVTAGYTSTAGGYEGYAAILLGRGDGTFSSASTLAMEAGGPNNWSLHLRLGDIDGDEILDLVTAGYANFQGQASVRLGRGDGTFGSRTTYATGMNPWNLGLDLADVSGDGILDLLATGNWSGQGRTSILRGISREGIAPILPFSLSTIADARQAMGILDQKLTALSTERGIIGAFQSRLQVAANTLYASRENSAAAGSRIMDADMAQESAALTRTQILQQSAAAVLGLASQQPALALSLLK